MKKRNIFTSQRYPLILLIITIVFFGITAINPPHPMDFFYEHIATVAFLAILIVSYRCFKFSNLSYTLIFLFMILHIIGARTTYAEVPYQEFFLNFGIDINGLFGFTRNNYDRLVHFCFGLFLAYPIREIFMRIASTKGIWSFYLPLGEIMGFSMIYELIEWQFAVIIGGDVSNTYLGSQGDVWDAQQDMAIATIGAIIALTVTFIIHLIYNRKLREEIRESLRVKKKQPLGEVALKKMMNG